MQQLACELGQQWVKLQRLVLRQQLQQFILRQQLQQFVLRQQLITTRKVTMLFVFGAIWTIVCVAAVALLGSDAVVPVIAVWVAGLLAGRLIGVITQGNAGTKPVRRVKAPMSNGPATPPPKPVVPPPAIPPRRPIPPPGGPKSPAPGGPPKPG